MLIFDQGTIADGCDVIATVLTFDPLFAQQPLAC